MERAMQLMKRFLNMRRARARGYLFAGLFVSMATAGAYGETPFVKDGRAGFVVSDISSSFAIRRCFLLISGDFDR